MFIAATIIAVFFVVYSLDKPKWDLLFEKYYLHSLLFLAFLLLLKTVSLAIQKDLDPDELVHLHCAWYVSQNFLPYADFFAHHHPLLWYTILPCFSCFGYSGKAIIAARVLMFFWTTGIVTITSMIANRVNQSRETGILAAILLLAMPMFILTGVEIRPDVPQVFFGVLSVYFLLIFFQTRGWKNLVLSAVSASISFLFLQKAIFLLLAYAAIFMRKIYQKEIAFKVPLYFLLCFSLPVAMFLALLAGYGLLADYFYTNWLFNMADRPNAFSPFRTLRSTWYCDAPFWVFTGAALCYFWRNRETSRTSRIIVFISLVLLLSLFTVRFPWPQYFMLAIALLCIVIAPYLVFCFAKMAWHPICRLALIGVVMVAPMAEVQRSVPSNRDQLELIDLVYRHSAAGDRIYDGSARFNIYRQDLHYFWFYVENSKKGLEIYNRVTGKSLNYDIYELIRTKRPRFISDFELDLKQHGLDRLYHRTKYRGLYVRKEPYSEITPAGSAVEYSDWPIFRGDQRLRGRAAGDLPGTWTLAWNYPTGAEIKSSPVIASGTVFIGSSDGKLYALDLKEGKQVWEFSTGGAVEAPPLFLAGTVYAGSADGTMYALDAESGRCRWRYETGGKIVGSANWGASASGEDAIVFGSYDNLLYCVTAGNGEKLWTYQTASYVNGSPAVVDGRVIVGGCDEHVHVVSIADGSLVTKIHAGSHIAASVAVDKGLAFVGHYQNKIICIDLSASKIMWEYGELKD